MAEQNESPAADADATSLTPRTRDRSRVSQRARERRIVATTAASVTRPPRAARRARGRAKPVRSLVIITMVAGLIATVALPAYGAWRPTAETQTLQQLSAGDAQSLVVASDATASTFTRDSYAATTAEEIEQKKAAEAAAAAAEARAKAAAAAASSAASSSSSSSSVAASYSVDLNMVSPGTGEVRWPLLNFTKGRGLWDSGYHQGVDLLAPAMTPIYAAAAGVVKVSQESYGGYGVAISIDHVLGGQQVNTLYGHMTYGTRQVQVGQTVAAGQLIGFVGSTGSSTANHTHFEVHINGGVVDPWAWLEANAG
ncbi:M23 family metallopeptidase [Microbacterium sp. P01]|uniref:M23 family metallopeptidase n=1 Tax=unclassified Microbacterium TaxID=2609290 RepID=UPI00366E80E3